MSKEKSPTHDKLSDRLLLVLIHSPLLGPFTWQPVAGELQRRDIEAAVPELTAAGEGTPYWRSHAFAIARVLLEQPVARSLVLIAHSGAGLLFPAVRQLAGRPVAAYIFVDAGIPEDGKSRLDLWHSEAPDVAAEVRKELERGESFPAWSEDDLLEVVPDPHLRRGLLAELHPQPLAYWDEAIPVFTGWPDAPCAYLQFSPPYASLADLAEAEGWPVRRLPAGHFHMLVDPSVVTELLLDLLKETGAISN